MLDGSEPALCLAGHVEGLEDRGKLPLFVLARITYRIVVSGASRKEWEKMVGDSLRFTNGGTAVKSQLLRVHNLSA
jgi:hypothetical protein